MLYRMKVANKRRVCPHWSVPVEVLLICLASSYTPIRGDAKRVIGSLGFEKFEHEYPAAHDEAHEVLTHVRRTGYGEVSDQGRLVDGSTSR